jgi:hypothetical protein
MNTESKIVILMFASNHFLTYKLQMISLSHCYIIKDNLEIQ